MPSITRTTARTTVVVAEDMTTAAVRTTAIVIHPSNFLNYDWCDKMATGTNEVLATTTVTTCNPRENSPEKFIVGTIYITSIYNAMPSDKTRDAANQDSYAGIVILKMKYIRW
jgi:hypothetical protein